MRRVNKGCIMRNMKSAKKISRQMESPLALLDGHKQPLTQDFDAAVVGQLEIVDASHYARKIVVRRVRGFAGTADNREHWRQALETC